MSSSGLSFPSHVDTPQVTVSDVSPYFLSKLLSLERIVRWDFESLPFELGTKSIKADGEETRQSSYNSNCVSR